MIDELTPEKLEVCVKTELELVQEFNRLLMDRTGQYKDVAMTFSTAMAAITHIAARQIVAVCDHEAEVLDGLQLFTDRVRLRTCERFVELHRQ